jgi:hypothetical protein
MIHCSYIFLIGMKFCIFFYKLWYLVIGWVEFCVVVIFGIVHFTTVIMLKIFFLTNRN